MGAIEISGEPSMHPIARLTTEEQRWLRALNNAPMVRPSAVSNVPTPILESLLGKRLVRWQHGFAAVALLVVTARGATVSA